MYEVVVRQGIYQNFFQIFKKGIHTGKNLKNFYYGEMNCGLLSPVTGTSQSTNCPNCINLKAAKSNYQRMMNSPFILTCRYNPTVNYSGICFGFYTPNKIYQSLKIPGLKIKVCNFLIHTY